MIGRRLAYELAGRVTGPILLGASELRRTRRRATPDDPSGPPLESTRRLKRLMGTAYYQGRFADGAVPVAWVTSGFPAELLRPYGFYVVYPENHAALCSARHMAATISEAAENVGYSRDLCSYARIDIGSVLSQMTPVGRIPRPDLLAVCTNICQTVMYWFRSLAAHLDVPLFVLDTPYVYGDFAPHHLEFVERQLEELMEVAARVSGRRAQPAALSRMAGEARKASLLWGECLAQAKNRPSPWTVFDQFFHMAPIVALRGRRDCTAYYRHLFRELESRAERGIGAIRSERHRLLWDNIAIWPKLRDMARFLASSGCSLVAATYTSAWCEGWQEYDPGDPLTASPRLLSGVILNRDLPNRLRIMTRLISDYEIDGVVLHSDRSCKPYSLGQYDLAETLRRSLGVRVVVIEADHADPRCFADQQVEGRLAAFVESLG